MYRLARDWMRRAASSAVPSPRSSGAHSSWMICMTLSSVKAIAGAAFTASRYTVRSSSVTRISGAISGSAFHSPTAFCSSGR